MLGKTGLHDVDRWGEHSAEPEADEEQAGHEGPIALGLGHEKQQDDDPCDRHKKTGNDEAPLGKLLGESLGGQ